MASSQRRSAKQAMPAAGFTHPAFVRIAELAHLFAGLVFPPNRQPSAEAGMRRAMSALRIGDPTALLRAVETPGAAREAVLAELTVGESYFFRDAAQLELLATDILPARVESHGPSRPLRIWSAGCASGEEPHTLAIMLREHRWPHPARILGTDVARPRLEAARRGRYTRWALRGVSDERIGRWFKRNGSYYDLERSICESVEYRSLNLVLDNYAIAEHGSDGYDLVLCRNVMIYFDLPTVARIATGLLASLAPDGWLVLGASDPLLTNLVACEAVMTPAGIAYRRADRVGAPTALRAPLPQVDLPRASPPAAAAHTPAPQVHDLHFPVIEERADAHDDTARVLDDSARVMAAPSTDDDMHRAYALARYPDAEAMAAIALATATSDADTLPVWITYVRAVANQGRLHEAGELAARALELHPLAAELHYLHATLLAEAGWFGDVATAVRRAIYLDRQFVMGHLLLGDALTRTGDLAGARIAFANVLQLLATASPDAPVAAADGVPAGRLRQIATLRLRTIDAEAKR